MSFRVIIYECADMQHNYPIIAEYIKSISNSYFHAFESAWIVESKLAPADIMGGLSVLLDPSDKLLVIDTSGAAAWDGMSIEISRWLKAKA